MTVPDWETIHATLRQILEYLSRSDVYVTTLIVFSLLLACLTYSRLRTVKQLTRRLAESRKRIAALEQEETRHKVRQARLVTIIHSERKSSAEKLSLLDEPREELRAQFSSLAHEIFQNKSELFQSQSKVRLESLLQPFHHQLNELKSEIQQTYLNDTRERTSLQKELNHLQQLNRQITQETVNLTRALKGDRKLQGNWGELVLERILEQSGLRNGHEYETQRGYRDQENRLLKPDVVLHLPDDKDIIIDSKVSLSAWERYCSCDEEKDQQAALNELAAAVRAHIHGLGEKNYEELEGIRSLDFILMFMPIDSAFMAAFNHDEKLFDDAFKQKIIVVTPTTLIATLRTIENIWRYEQQSRNSLEIARRAGSLYDKFRNFIEDLEKIGRQLDACQASYDQAMAKLLRGRGNLVAQAQQLIDLGVQVKKELPKALVEKADTELRN